MLVSMPRKMRSCLWAPSKNTGESNSNCLGMLPAADVEGEMECVLMAQMGFFDVVERYAGLDAKKDPLLAINASVPWEQIP